MNAQPLSGPALVTELDALLHAMAELYGKIGEALQSHEAAIRRADSKAIKECVELQRPLWGRAEELDRQRREITARAASTRPELVRLHGTQIKLTMLAGLTTEAPRLVQVAEKVRALIEAVHGKVKLIRAASESLLTHMEGIARQIAGSLNHAGTYGRRGRVESGPSVISALDLRS
ncbi:MAG: flagellar export chaperone FlgN [Phycisphaerales bacterium]|jgi:hypothetical protein